MLNRPAPQQGPRVESRRLGGSPRRKENAPLASRARLRPVLWPVWAGRAASVLPAAMLHLAGVGFPGPPGQYRASGAKGSYLEAPHHPKLDRKGSPDQGNTD